MLGTLYVVATPIGNLEDISARALQVLKTVDYIAAEDTRHSKKLLQHFGIKTRLLALHEYNERDQVKQLIEHLAQGKNIALISDAGTPLISDPGYALLQAVIAQQISIVPIPGACAAVVALSAAGLPTDHFLFEGFLPVKNAARLQRLQILQRETRTLIFYEAPHRILSMLQDLQQIFGGQRAAVVARELTKTFETIYRGTLAEVLAQLQQNPQQVRGEFVVLVHGAEAKSSTRSELETEKILKILLAELPLKQAASLAAQITGQSKNDLYQLALQLKT
jgi:16S rRNA (cytidine1402-2'-O)-methyltransferase